MYLYRTKAENTKMALCMHNQLHVQRAHTHSVYAHMRSDINPRGDNKDAAQKNKIVWNK